MRSILWIFARLCVLSPTCDLFPFYANFQHSFSLRQNSVWQLTTYSNSRVYGFESKWATLFDKDVCVSRIGLWNHGPLILITKIQGSRISVFVVFCIYFQFGLRFSWGSPTLSLLILIPKPCLCLFFLGRVRCAQTSKLTWVSEQTAITKKIYPDSRLSVADESFQGCRS